jgi:hypothetical protein
MASALEAAVRIAGSAQLAAWVKSTAGASLADRARIVSEIERGIFTGTLAGPGPTLGDAASPHSQVSTVLSSTSTVRETLARGRPARVAIALGLATVSLGGVLVVAVRRPSAPAAASPTASLSATESQELGLTPIAATTAVSAPAPPPTPVEPYLPPSKKGGAPRLVRQDAPRAKPRTLAPHVSVAASADAPPKAPDCKVEQYLDNDGFVRFRCAP